MAGVKILGRTKMNQPTVIVVNMDCYKQIDKRLMQYFASNRMATLRYALSHPYSLVQFIHMEVT
jgi:hypothetical protein